MKAFPSEHPIPGYMDLKADGMDLRDYFAAKAMQGLLTQGEDYLDFYCGGACKNINLYGRDPTEGTVTERIRIDLLTLGWSWSDDIFNQEQEEDKECVQN